MSYYYKYKFVSPEPIYARVKEDLQSYFDTGIIDDTLFPKYTEYCLKKMGKVAFKVNDTPIEINEHYGTLPNNFYAVRELFSCGSVEKFPVNLGTAEYQQVTTQLTPYLNSCQDCVLRDILVTTKEQGFDTIRYSYRIGHLLTPGTISALEKCSVDSGNLYSKSDDSFDIHDNKVVVNFKKGLVHLVYYGNDVDDNENQLIPDIIEFSDYLEAYIKFKCFETIFNKITDESFNQVYEKYKLYKSEQGIKYVVSLSEFRKQSIYDIKRSILTSYKSNQHYQKMLWSSGNTFNKFGW